MGVFLVDDYYAGGDAGAIKEVGRQADDARDIALADKGAADIGFGIAAEEDAVRQNACALASVFKGADDVEEVSVVALARGRNTEGLEALVGIVGEVDAVGPALVAEGRIGDDLVEGLEGVADFEFGIGKRVALLDDGHGSVVQDHVHAG